MTTKRLHGLKHYGDVSRMKGSEVEPVDIITFGSPCQDMSIAGKREGLEGSRSSLYYETIRIVREMREASHGEYPKYIVWENVTGALSSNGGEDFRCVLESICRIKDPSAAIPAPVRWEQSGKIVADDYSVAWRVLDAQYWGVPQRRKRVYLVADFAGQRAGKILFESEGVSGYSTAGFKAWQRAAGGTEGGSGASVGVCLNDQGGSRMDVTGNVAFTLRAEAHHSPITVQPATVYENHSQDGRYNGPLETADTLTARYGTGGNNQPLVIEGQKTYDVRFTSEGTRNARQNCYETDTARTIDTGGNAPDSNQGGVAVVNMKVYGISSDSSHAMLSDNPHAGIYEAETSRTLDTRGGDPACNQGGIAVVAVEGNGARPSHRGNGYSEEGVSFTLNTTENHAVAYGIDRATYNMGRNARFGITVREELEPTIVAKDPGAVAHPVLTTSKSSCHMDVDENLANTLIASDYKDPPIVTSEPEYIVRRLTPTECARLQGFPDWWCSGLGEDNPSDEEMEFWRGVFETHRRTVTHAKKPKTDRQIRKWLHDPHTDSAEYKMWGNGVALSCVFFVLSGIVYCDQSPALKTVENSTP